MEGGLADRGVVVGLGESGDSGVTGVAGDVFVC